MNNRSYIQIIAVFCCFFAGVLADDSVSSGAIVGYVFAALLCIALICSILVGCVILAPFILSGLLVVCVAVVLLPLLFCCGPCICIGALIIYLVDEKR
jgi:hypothetical protein